MSDPLIGKQLGDYVIQSLLGRGGMARVYKGYDERLQRYAAVKVINNDFSAADQEEYTERFRREARAIAHLHHPNIVGVYQFGEFEGNYYMAMVFLDGKDLRQILKDYAEQHQYMPLPDVLSIIQGMGSALDYAHSRGVIHRDIKPSNIVIDTDKRPILTDFGLALNMSEGTLGDTFGSAHYIAPEQAVSSAKAVPQSDLYSLGVCLYEMLAGKVPFDDPSAMSVALKHLNDAPPPPRLFNPSLSPAIEQIVLRMLDKDPAQRFPSGAVFAQAFEAAIHADSARPGTADEIGLVNMDRSGLQADGVKGTRGTRARAKSETKSDSKSDRDSSLRPKRTRQLKAKAAAAPTESAVESSATESSATQDLTPLTPPSSPDHAAAVLPAVSAVIPPAIPQDLPQVAEHPPVPPTGQGKQDGKAENHAAAVEHPPEQSHRRMRWLTPLLAIVVVALLVGLGAVFASGALNGGPTPTPTLLPTTALSSRATASVMDARTQTVQTALAAQTALAGQTAVALAVARTQSATARASSTASRTASRTATTAVTRTTTRMVTRTASPTPSRTITQTATQTVTQTVTQTASQTASQTNTATASITVSATASPTPVITANAGTVPPTDTPIDTPTGSPTSAVPTTEIAATPVKGTAGVLLVYDQSQIDIINAANYPIDISGLSFVQDSKAALRFDIAKFWTTSTPFSASALPSQFCYQIYPIDHSQPASLKDCRNIAAWARVADIRWFWMAQDSSISNFNVLSGDRIIATCSISAGRCEFSLS